MITTLHLAKHYPGRVAVRDLSFEVQPREVAGLLGPNGSGKSTTMRMLAGFLVPSSGVARVAGFDVTLHPMEVRRRIGYLPENCPLYPEMRVDEYLDFRASLKGVPARNRRQRIGEVRELCGLADSGRRIIGQLSKGYRQRVGLAEAMIHDPELLILDEPTVGLDPNQMRQVRALIQQLAARHTILLSTHILSEVEATCQRIIIINEGRIVAAGPTDHLMRNIKGAAQIHAEIKAGRREVEARIRAWPEVSGLTIETEGDWLRITLTCAAAGDLRPRLFRLAAAEQWDLRELHREPGKLEDLFTSITTSTGESSRDA